ncbi:MAG: hypothetical protein WCB27_17825 [Thermoguttaceae bacterium]|jgi:hypothetical protein
MFYLIVWCEESKQWWQADECEARSLRRARALLRGRNPRLVLGGVTAVVEQDDLAEALTRNPCGQWQDLPADLVAA